MKFDKTNIIKEGWNKKKDTYVILCKPGTLLSILDAYKHYLDRIAIRIMEA